MNGTRINVLVRSLSNIHLLPFARPNQKPNADFIQRVPVNSMAHQLRNWLLVVDMHLPQGQEYAHHRMMLSHRTLRTKIGDYQPKLSHGIHGDLVPCRIQSVFHIGG